MTTKIKWRLANRPTPQEVLDLTNGGLLTKEEAREILFSLEDDSKRDTGSLESEIKFLRELVAKLANKQEIVKVYETIHLPYNSYPWIAPYAVWCAAVGTTTPAYTVTSANLSATATGTNTVNLVYSYDDNTGFDQIETFHA